MEEKMRILAVDDNIINLATIEQELKNKYEVITVNSGARAIRGSESATLSASASSSFSLPQALSVK